MTVNSTCAKFLTVIFLPTQTKPITQVQSPINTVKEGFIFPKKRADCFFLTKFIFQHVLLTKKR